MIYDKTHYLPIQLADLLWSISSEAYSYGAPWTAAQFESDLRLATSTYFLYSDETEILGFIGTSIVLDEAEITTIAVAEKGKRRGIARQLLTHFFEHAKNTGVTQVFLEVRESNDPAKQLYLSSGFKEIGRRKNYYHRPAEDALVMSLTIKDGSINERGTDFSN